MPFLDTSSLAPGHALPSSVNHQIYCALDSLLLPEIFPKLDELRRGADEAEVSGIYNFERGLQGPYLEIMLRGFAVDERARRSASEALRQRILSLRILLDDLARSAWDSGLNPRSSAQISALFYETMKLPEVWISQKGERKRSMNREALEKLDDYLYAKPFVSLILAIRDLSKQLEVLETEIDSDGRFRTSYNIAGTETGRSSSSSNAFGTGGNVQNIAPLLRYVFVADRGKKLGQIDLEQVEARDVGFFCGCLFDDWDFLNACESGDLHTNNARRIWTELHWTGDQRKDREIADRNFYRDFSYRDMAKRGSHLSNYMGTAWTASRALKVPIAMMEEFQARYCRGREERNGLPVIAPAYPALPRFWQWCAEQLQTTHKLTTPFGRRRHFFGRPGDDATLREAIAFLPQSTTADRLKLALWRVWRQMPEVELLGEGYDSMIFQYEDRGAEYEGEVISKALDLLRVELVSPSGRNYVVPGEAKVGWNWGAEVTERDVKQAQESRRRVPRLNRDGLKKWSPRYPDIRRRTDLLAKAQEMAK